MDEQHVATVWWWEESHIDTSVHCSIDVAHTWDSRSRIRCVCELGLMLCLFNNSLFFFLFLCTSTVQIQTVLEEFDVWSVFVRLSIVLSKLIMETNQPLQCLGTLASSTNDCTAIAQCILRKWIQLIEQWCGVRHCRLIESVNVSV